MRILHINKRYPPHVGGIEKSLQNLSRVQSRRPGLEVEVVCVTEGTEPGYERDGRVAVHRVAQQALAAANPLAVGILKALRHSQHDVWHFHYPFPTGELALLLSPRRVGFRVRSQSPRPVVVCTYHSDLVGETGLKRALAAPYAALTRAFLQATDAVLVGSPQLAERSLFLPAVADKVRVVPFGINTEHLRPTPAILGAAADLRRRQGSPLVLFVGRLVPYKGVDVLLRALPAVPEAHVVLVGEGPLRAELEELARSLGLSHRVSFAGALSDESLAAHYHAADLFVLPSVTPNEAFGLVQLEAHACGVPVVSTNLPTGVPFVNKHGESGLVVEPGDAAGLSDALARLLRDPELRTRLGRQARQRQEKEFSLEVMADGVMAAYRELLDCRDARGCGRTRADGATVGGARA